MRSLLRRLLKLVVAHYYRSKPVTDWPRWAGDLLEVKIPANVTRKIAPSPEGGSNINIILALLGRTRDVPGDIAECGVFKGSSLMTIAMYLRENGLAKHVYALNSFQGFDGSVRKDMELGGAADREKRVGGFEATSLADVQGETRQSPLTRYYHVGPRIFR